MYHVNQQTDNFEQQMINLILKACVDVLKDKIINKQNTNSDNGIMNNINNLMNSNDDSNDDSNE